MRAKRRSYSPSGPPAGASDNRNGRSDSHVRNAPHVFVSSLARVSEPHKAGARALLSFALATSAALCRAGPRRGLFELIGDEALIGAAAAAGVVG
jgi:hypothetical protein